MQSPSDASAGAEHRPTVRSSLRRLLRELMQERLSDLTERGVGVHRLAVLGPGPGAVAPSSRLLPVVHLRICHALSSEPLIDFAVKSCLQFGASYRAH